MSENILGFEHKSIVKMNLPEQFQHFIKKESLFQSQDRLLLAVSGGLDSVVLCDLSSKSGFNFAIAHANFQLRGEESNEDEDFVKKIAKKYQAEVFVKKFETEAFAEKNKWSIQVAARTLRYEWFHSIIDPSTGQPFNNLLTAHHANDNIETLLMNFFKGTGIAGLRGIMPKSGSIQNITRPLLFAKRKDILIYAKEQNLVYREDSSNLSNKYTRNYFRNQVIPLVREAYPQVEDNLLDNISRFHDVNFLYQQSIETIKKKLILEKNNAVHLPVLKLLKTGALQTVLFEITRKYDFTSGQTADIVKLLDSESGKYIDSSSHRILRNRAWLIITKLGEKGQGHFLIGENDHRLFFSNHVLTIDKLTMPGKIDEDPAVALLDASNIKFPLLIRKWEQGDYFYPLGMRKKKKLSRFFIDKKLSMNEKENVWVIEMNKKIIWIAGMRIDDRFKLTTGTRDIFRFSLSPA